jgi:hypothetical protein
MQIDAAVESVWRWSFRLLPEVVIFVSIIRRVLQTMHFTKGKTIASLMVWAVLLGGSALLAHRPLAGSPQRPANGPRDQAEQATRDQLTAESFAHLHKLMQPRPGEYRWDEIPWVASIWHARKQAAAENKPIFIFGTAGAGFNDPLGNC